MAGLVPANPVLLDAPKTWMPGRTPGTTNGTIALAALSDLSLFELLIIATMAIFASVIGGVAGYGTGALMPLVLVPIVGAEPVVPIIAISALFTNTSRVAAFRRSFDRRRAAIALVAAVPTC